MTRRTVLAFLLGFFQVIVSIIVESLVIYYLSTMDELMTIIVKFVSLAKIVQFDDMYAKSLYEHTIQGVKSKQLKVFFYRRYMFADKFKGDSPERAVHDTAAEYANYN